MTWNLIDTAPKDGTVILGCYISSLEDSRGDPMYYYPKAVFFGTYHPNAPGKKLWREAGSGHKILLSHWMPLPEAPGTVRPFKVDDSVKFTRRDRLYTGIVEKVGRTLPSGEATLVIRTPVHGKFRVHSTNVKPLHGSDYPVAEGDIRGFDG